MQIRNLGFIPSAVFDIGAQDGTPDLYQAFPESTHILIEPVQENEEKLKEVCKGLRFATYMIAAAGKKTGVGTLKITKNNRYSGLVSKETAVDFDTHYHREITTIAIDDLIVDGKLKGPFLLKIDVDGLEVDVIEGATETLKYTGVAVIESTLFFQIHDVINAMSKAGFVIFDIVEPLYRPLDGALWQVDIVFVPKDSPLRKNLEYAAESAMKTLRCGKE